MDLGNACSIFFSDRFLTVQKKSQFYHSPGGTNNAYQIIHIKITKHEMYDNSAYDPTFKTFLTERRVFH